METTDKKRRQERDEADPGDFWNLPPVHKKTYAPPSFDGRTTDTIPISGAVEKGIDVAMAIADAVPQAEARTEAIPPRDPSQAPASARPVRPADRTFKTASYATSRGYRDRMQTEQGGDGQNNNGFFGDFDNIESPVKQNPGEVVSDRVGEGWLIRQVTVRTWINDFSFYAGFGRNAADSHNRRGIPVKHVPYGSFVPQYGQMDDRQVAFYLWFRDNARVGQYLEADFAYILLYIFEILNLPDLIPPETGMQILCGLWAHYREKYRKLDTYLCEWVPDYALIHDVPLPSSLEPFLGDIVRRAQCKEFYLDNMTPPGGKLSKRAMEVLASVLLEAYSDYDYTKSRYYTGGNQELYDRTIREVLTEVLMNAYEKNTGMFALDRVYRLTRDSYCGAIIQTDRKRRIDIAFNSCIRSPDTRRFVTGIVKYTENRLRTQLKIKAKLGTAELNLDDRIFIDRLFGPVEVEQKRKGTATTVQQKEEEAYLKQYEAESVGFDFSAAHRIESDSWVNTSRLTGEEPEESLVSVGEMAVEGESEYSPDVEEEIPGAVEMTDGEEMAVSDTDSIPVIEVSHTDGTENGDSPDHIVATEDFEGVPAHDRHSLEKEAVGALLAGRFVVWCRERGLFPGRMAEQINEIFLDVVGDILIEADGFTLIEDYREDATAWCNNLT